MATDLDVSTATFGTADMLPASGDVGLSTWAQQAANNTGLLYQRIIDTSQMVMAQQTEVSDSNTQEEHRAYISSGTYSVHIAGYINANGDGVNIDFGGTTLWNYPTGTGWQGTHVDGFVVTQDGGTAFTSITINAGNHSTTRVNSCSAYVTWTNPYA